MTTHCLVHAVRTRTRVTRHAAALLLAAGLVLGVGVPGAAADGPVQFEKLNPATRLNAPPRLLDVVPTGPTSLRVRWEDRSLTEGANFPDTGFQVRARQDGAQTVTIALVPALPGTGSIGSSTLPHLEPNRRYCVWVHAALPVDTGGEPRSQTEVDPRTDSAQQCVTTPPAGLDAVPARQLPYQLPVLQPLPLRTGMVR